MNVLDVFCFEDGRTVFLGKITSGPNYISACVCELVIAGTPVCSFKIEDEMLPSHKTQKNMRSISTTEQVDVALVRRSFKHCMVRGV